MGRTKKEPHFYYISEQFNYAVVYFDDGETFNVSLEDLEYVLQYRWHISLCNKRIQGVKAYIKVDGNTKNVYLHREIFKRMNLHIQGLQVDHIDLNTLNNTRDNLRLVTHQQNNMNKVKHCDNNSGYKGVSWSKLYKKWVVYISVNGKHKNLGYFKNVEEAALAYDKAAIQYHGDYGRLNFPNLVLENPTDRVIT